MMKSMTNSDPVPCSPQSVGSICPCLHAFRLTASIVLLLVVSVLGAGGGVRQPGERDGGHEEEAQDHRPQDAHPTDHGTSSEDSVYCINRLVCVLFKGM